MQPSDEIKSKLDIVDIIRDYVQIKPAGMNFRANCPFHREKTPSFMVSPDKQIWHCFGCGKGGDVISFVMDIEGVDFMEALRILAPKAGVVLRRFEGGPAASKRSRIIDILESSADYYHKILLEDKRAFGARKYLAERGLNDQSISEWQIGFSLNDWDDLILYLKRKGFSDAEIFSAGMSVKKEGTNR
jgi:DNA primase